ncbi:DNA polymerase sliding clamp [uncultured archaeon]|nr:DNA polymerase sliding clamp [uncultured archaeon]
MFEATVVDTKNFRNSIDAIAALIDEGTLQITAEGIKLRAMDPSQIALVDFFLPASAFENYQLKSPTSVGIDFVELAKLTKRMRPEDKLEIALDKRLNLLFKGTTTRRFSLSVIDSTSTPPKEPKIEFAAEVKISPSLIKEAFKDAELVSNHVALSIADGFQIKSDGDTGSVDISFSDEGILGIDKKKEARAVFSLEHLNNILKAAEAPAVVSLSMRTDAPLRVEYAVGDGRVIYYLAPRIET